MRRRSISATVIAVTALASFTGAASAAAAKPRVTMISDSVGASLIYAPKAVTLLGKGLDLRMDLRVCRRLVDVSCPYQGFTPPTALEAIQVRGSALGRVLVIDVGYNDDPARYKKGMTRIMAAAKKAGVTSVVWVTLGESRSMFAQTNAVMRSAAKRYPSACVADWATYSRGRPWFGGDGLHLNAAGAMGLAKLVRPFAVRAAKTGSCAPASAPSAAPAPSPSSPQVPAPAPSTPGQSQPPQP